MINYLQNLLSSIQVIYKTEEIQLDRCKNIINFIEDNQTILKSLIKETQEKEEHDEKNIKENITCNCQEYEKKKKLRYKCTYEGCEKGYGTKENLRLHTMNFHLKEKPFVCGHCDMKFSHRNGKIYHERTRHLQYFPYQCSNCEKKFPCKSAMNFHIVSKH